MTKKKLAKSGVLKQTVQPSSSSSARVDPTAFHDALNRSMQRQQKQNEVVSQQFTASVARARQRLPNVNYPIPVKLGSSRKNLRDNRD